MYAFYLVCLYRKAADIIRQNYDIVVSVVFFSLLFIRDPESDWDAFIVGMILKKISGLILFENFKILAILSHSTLSHNLT